MPLWLSRIGWFVAIWAASVTVMFVVGGVLRFWLR